MYFHKFFPFLLTIYTFNEKDTKKGNLRWLFNYKAEGIKPQIRLLKYISPRFTALPLLRFFPSRETFKQPFFRSEEVFNESA